LSSLDLNPDLDIEPWRLLIEAVWLVGGIYLLGLWCYALIRSRLRLFWLLVISNVVAVAIDLIGVVTMFSDDPRDATFLGVIHASSFRQAMYGVKPVFFLLNLVAYTLIVRRIIRAKTDAMQPPKV
jgi:hypothetical protein